MAIWAIADLHLSFGVADKKMDIFGPAWEGWTDKIATHWNNLISEDDLILIAGDTSWAMRPEEAVPDLEWVDKLPGTKVLLRGNHDYWWASVSKVQNVLPPSLHIIQNNTFDWGDVSIGGARLWDTSEYNFNAYIEFIDNPKAKMLTEKDKKTEEAERIFSRELGRLEMSLKNLNPNAKTRIAMTHYPPISADLKDSQASALLEKYNVDICVFGHLHNVKTDLPMFGEHHGVNYALTSCDYLDFKPLKLL